ncbi:MAG: DMT family transporter, partial [Casimicrobiaceae bacterium]
LGGSRAMTPLLAAAGAILLWSTLAALGLALAHLPPFLLTGCALVIGALPGVVHWRRWRVPLPTLLLGIGGLFGFHFLLFLALRLAPPVEANLVNYLWPLLIVVLTPVLLPGWRLTWRHALAALLGFAGAMLAIGAAPVAMTARSALGFALAAGSATVWACYSLLCRRVPAFSSWAIGGFALASGLLALACHALFEPAATLRSGDFAKLAVLGLGPMGAAFYLWDIAMKRGDPRVTGVLAYATPLLSTTLLLLTTGRPLTLALAAATALIVGAAVLAVTASAPRAS